MHTYNLFTMSAPPVPHHRSNYNDSMWNTYITEAIQSGNHKQYCKAHNINYKTFNRKYTEYKQSNDKQNWSPKSKRRYRHRVFTDSTEKQAVDKYLNKYHRQHKPADSGDLAAELMKIHNEKYPDREVIHVSRSTLTRINQQYKLSSKRVSKRKHTMMSIDDSVITEYQSKLNDIFVIYEDHDLIMNSDHTRIPQSMVPTNTLCPIGEHIHLNS